jgi:hypothetical protein
MSLPILILRLTIICGLQGGGKSHLIRYIIYENQKKFDWGIVFSNTGFLADNFEYIDKQFIHSKYDEFTLSNLKSIHEQLVEKGKKPSGFVIFDDCLFGKQWRSEEFLSLMTQLWHYGITCIISCQYPQAIPPVFCSNAFQVAIFNITSKPTIEALYNLYRQMFDSYTDFKKYLLENTGDHYFVFYDARNGATSLDERYKVMKCPEKIPDFVIQPQIKIE